VPGRLDYQYEINKTYLDAVLEAEGIPFVLPYTAEARILDELLDRVNGLLVTGGAFDIPPDAYGESRRGSCGPIKRGRTDFERALVAGALRRDLPILGICGGMQLLNVVLGGSLYQDIATDLPDAEAHLQKSERTFPSHPVTVKRGTLLARSVGDGTLMVNSTHHQAVRALGMGVQATAHANDGVVEAVEGIDYTFAVGVQWHPEALFYSVPANLGLYRGFVKAALRGST
jgi:putative glutamine amidotransferase